MKEIRLHGRGGQGVIKAAHILVQTVVGLGGYAHFIPFFGVERKGSPVYGFARLDDRPIRQKDQVYQPHCVLVFAESLIQSVPVYAGLREGGIVLINSAKDPAELNLPAAAARIGVLDATGLAQSLAGSEIPNTAMLGALARLTGWVDLASLTERIAGSFGAANAAVARAAYEQVRISSAKGAVGHG